MNSRSQIIRTAVVLILSFVFPFTSVMAQAKRRAVKPGLTSPAAPATALLSGTVVDATTNAPVVAVLVRLGARSGRTDSQGKFAIKLSPGSPQTLTFERTGYDTLSSTVTITGDDSQTFRLIPRGTIKIRLNSGVTYQIDPETIEFGYVAPFSGYNKDTKLNLCKGGGDAFQPDRADIKHITTGATLNDAKCCATGAIPAINVELKSGGTTTAGFVDACFDYKVDVIGLDHITAQPVYIHFSDIAELTFP
jgi:carboxypeptidase-like protein